MRTRTLKSVLAGGVCALALTTAAHAENREFAVPAGELSQALDLYIRQSGEQLIYRVADVRGMKSPGVSGALSTEEALARLLEGTSLTIKRDASGLIAVASMDPKAPQSGSAAGGGAEVEALIVTAQKREEDIQDVPIAISAFSQEDLTRSQVAGGADLMTQVPNMTFTKTNFSSYSIQIRGIGTQAISATTDPAVAVAFNNTPFIRNRFFEQEFYDLQRVEVLRGPQGTLYGRNATAGVVNIISAKPTNHFEAKASADVSNYKSSRIEGMINLPLVEDKAALRIAGAWTRRDGYVKNILAGEQTDGRDLWSTRVTLGLTPTDRFSANLIWEHFEENDDRLRSGKQLCHKDLGPAEISGVPVLQTAGTLINEPIASDYSQGCLPASLYSPDSYQTPNGFALPYGASSAELKAPVANEDAYLSATQSRDLREIETYFKPEYTASTDVVELQLQYELTDALTLASETAFSRDRIFSFEDYNRFAARPNTILDLTDTTGATRGIVCNAQIGCSDRVQAGDLSTARSQHFSQEFRLSSNYEGAFNFSVGANFLRYDSEDKYYVFINSIGRHIPTDTFENRFAFNHFDLVGYAWSNPDRAYDAYNSQTGSSWTDGNDIHHLSDLGRNYFLSKNPYNLLSYAAFGEAYFNLTDNLKITGGLRWTVDKKVAPQIPSWLLAEGTYGLPTRKTFRMEWREPTGRVAIDWKPDLDFTDETLVYASYVRGYKAGGSNPPPAVVVFAGPIGGLGLSADAIARDRLTKPEIFDPEFVDAFEIGTKNTVLDGRMTLNLNAFYYDYTGYQISQIVDRSAANLNFDAKIWGSEFEVSYRPLENLRLSFRGGYENTRMADGSKAIDLIDRTAGDPNYVVMKPFPTFTSNCIVPANVALYADCEGYYFPDLDPYTSLPYVPNPTVMLAAPGSSNIMPIALFNGVPYPGLQVATVPNNGEGIFKDLSGNELPNAPHFTATVTADYTLPLPHDWLATLHTDLYYQSEAWTRVFNMPGYDKLKAYSNINVAAIFSNENAGWQVMAYVKNVLDKDNITGAFLNSDDTGLATNVFLNEPRLYGLRVTKNWNGSAWWSARANTSGHYPYRLEFDGAYGRVSGGKEVLAPATVALFPEEHPYPLGVQNDLDWASAGGVKFSWQPEPTRWSFSAGVRYGRASGGAEEHPKWEVPEARNFSQAKYESLIETFKDFPSFVEQIKQLYILNPSAEGWYNYATTTAESKETHAIAEFSIGKDVGLGWAKSKVALGLRYAQLNSDSQVVMHGRPDLEFPDPVKYEGGHMHRFHSSFEAHREFSGAGPAVSWDSAIPLPVIGADAGSLELDIGLSGAVLFGRQSAATKGEVHGEYNTGIMRRQPPPDMEFPRQEISPYSTPLDYHRSTGVTVPGFNANLGLTYTLGGLKVSGGYRIERYLDAVDGGIEERQTYDRQFDGPYFKISVGFGG